MTIIRENKLIEQLTITDVVCDRCKESCKKIDKYGGQFEFSRINAEWGYWSTKDGQTLDLTFCEKCTDDILVFINQKVIGDNK